MENNGQQVIFCEICGSNNVIRDTSSLSLLDLPLHLIPIHVQAAIPVFLFSKPILFKCNMCQHVTKVSKKDYKKYKLEIK